MNPRTVYTNTMNQLSACQSRWDSMAEPDYEEEEEEMDEYQVTIPFTKAVCGWYTGYCKANSAREAENIIKLQASIQGWKGPHKKIMVEVRRGQ